jgi:FKBP-type peptidyl-prolyl cis-trans isomerase
MKFNSIVLGLLFLVIMLFSGCLGEPQGPNIRKQFEQDVQSIEDYLSELGITEYDTLEGGVRFYFLDYGEGQLFSYGTTVQVDYIGSLLTDLVFDTTIEEVAIENEIHDAGRTYVPVQIVHSQNGSWMLQQFVTGFAIGTHKLLMTRGNGSKAIFYIPSFYGYGNARVGVIPKNSVLIFEVHLYGI